MTDPSSIESCAADLRTRCAGTVTVAPKEAAFSRDFGGIVRRAPAIVFRPSDVEGVAEALTIARRHGLTVTARGSGHSQSGQSVSDGVVVDMRGIHRILRVSPSEGLVEAEAGASWRRVVDATFAEHLLPIGLTHVVDTTVAGTLSVGGVGSESWRVGPQVDNVAFLDVATLDGDVIRTSRTENRALFDAVRGGLGQCGVIVRAGYPLRPCRARIRSRYFVYRGPKQFLGAVEVACARGAASFVSGVFARDARDPRNWVLLLVLGFECDDGSQPEDSWVRSLDADEELPHQESSLWSPSGIPGHLFFRLYSPAPGSLEATATTLRPWVDHVFSRDAAGEVLDELISKRWPVLSLGTAALIFIRRGVEPAPLFSMPNVDFGWGIGIFPSIPPEHRDGTLELMAAYSRRGCELGGKRYLSGYVNFEDRAAWAEHYGAAWATFRDHKRRFDPGGLLNPEFIRWD